METYTCSMCKTVMQDVPAFKNAAGSFCESCKRIIFSRMHEAGKKRTANREAQGFPCVWCGVSLTEQNSHVNGGSNDARSVCTDCQRHRDWLLKCIRLSDKPFKYIITTEEREAPLRLERAKKMHEEPVIESSNCQHDAAEARLQRMERMLNKLMSDLGVQ